MNRKTESSGGTGGRTASILGIANRRVSSLALSGFLAVTLGVAGCDRADDEVVRAPAAESRSGAGEPLTEEFPTITTRTLSASVAGADWPVYGGSYNNNRFSALARITPENVSDLAPVWVYQTGMSGPFVTTPIVVGRTMYLTTPESHVVALDAATGEKQWEFVPTLETTILCCGPLNRGVAVYGDRVFVGTIDAQLMALDNRTGEALWDVQVADPEDGYSITMAPLAYDDKVLVGVSGGEYGIRGFVAAYEAETGDELWRFHTIPAPADTPSGWWGDWTAVAPFGSPLGRDIAAEKEQLEESDGDMWEDGGGGVYMTPAYDPESGLLYMNVGNPSPDLAGGVRPGDNLFTGSILALNGETGEYIWHFQYLPHDRWNLSGGSPPFLLQSDGRKLVAFAGKTGWLYVLDARTGEPVLRSQNFVPQWNLFSPPSSEGTPMAPGANGGAGAPVAYSPVSGLAYIPAGHQPMLFTRGFTAFQTGVPWLGGTMTYLPDEEQWGVLSAIDINSGEVRWQRKTPMPITSAALATAGGVVFVGQGSGTFDAFHAESGELLWRFPTGAGVHSGPVTYSAGGAQYVVIAAGGSPRLGTSRGDDIIAFALSTNGSQRSAAPAIYPQPSYDRGEPQRYGAVRQIRTGGQN